MHLRYVNCPNESMYESLFIVTYPVKEYRECISLHDADFAPLWALGAGWYWMGTFVALA